VEEGTTPVIEMISPSAQLPVARIRELAAPLRSERRVMVIAGFHHPDAKLNRALARIAALPNCVVLTETIANLHNPLFVSRIDSTLCRMSNAEKEALRPDTVITVGGALVSRHIKEWMRSLPKLEHWHVGYSHTTVDCFCHLSMRINIDETTFMSQLASALQPHSGADGQLAGSDYASRWQEIATRALREHRLKLLGAPWSTLKAFAAIIKALPPTANLHLSNGTSIRYAQLMDCSGVHRCECNRGVSGIDGSTSTALGASVGYRSGETVLITGDMSMQYDIAALSSSLLSPRFKIIVMCNDGGEIFRFIESTSALPELEKYLAVGTRLPLSDLCHGYGLRYFEAGSEQQLAEALPEFFAERERPALLAVHTSGSVSAEVLRGYFRS
ncbi:MAG: 2-succinyl-5-enolpyruvyl-6-hydroxy-3-cyclohexene-1-carboxylic-acid synthase, partial [Duncaniella sp.]|nr:2-succinyl-5-enolpyruvyl-6-hydroxy-3-cyclohexene-1-carboxylic-acid synthase [Duncaniella sp.]